MPLKRPIRIRRATTRDLDALVHHRREMWREISDHTKAELDAADRVYRRWARNRLRSGKLVGWLAEAPGRQIVAGGCVWLRENQPRPGWNDQLVPYMLSMYTEPAYRGNRLASRIVREAVRWAKKKGYERMTLHASYFGREVYERAGFKQTMEMRLRLRPRRRKRKR